MEGGFVRRGFAAFGLQALGSSAPTERRERSARALVAIDGVAFEVKGFAGADDDLFGEKFLHPFDDIAFLVDDVFDDGGVGIDLEILAFHGVGDAEDFAEDLVADGGFGLEDAASVAVEARFVEGATEAFADALAGHFDETEIGDLEDIGFGAIALESGDKGGADAVAVFGAFHVDEVDDDQTADVSDAELIDDFGDGFEVGLEDGVLEVFATDKASGIDIDGGESFGLVDHEVATAFEPDFAGESAFEFGGESEGIEDRASALVEFDGEGGVGHIGLEEALDAVVIFGVVEQDAFGFVIAEVADGAEGDVEIEVQEFGGLGGFFTASDLFPEAEEKVHVVFELFFGGTFGDGANDKAAFFGANGFHEVAEAFAFFGIVDPARDADMREAGEKDEVATWEGDVGGEAGAFGTEGFFGDLDGDRLPFLKDLFDPEFVFWSDFRGGMGVFFVVIEGEIVGETGISDVEEGGFFLTDIDKSGLHTGEDANDTTAIDIADDALVVFALDVEFGEPSMFEEGDADFGKRRVNNEQIAHERDSMPRTHEGRPGRKLEKTEQPEEGESLLRGEEAEEVTLAFDLGEEAAVSDFLGEEASGGQEVFGRFFLA